jgi:hypothetical protein
MAHWFCNHIWKLENTEYLYSFRQNGGSIVCPMPYDVIIDVYAITIKCLKCGDKKIKKQESLHE